MVALVDYFGGGFIAYLLVLLEVVSVSYIYGTVREVALTLVLVVFQQSVPRKNG